MGLKLKFLHLVRSEEHEMVTNIITVGCLVFITGNGYYGSWDIVTVWVVALLSPTKTFNYASSVIVAPKTSL